MTIKPGEIIGERVGGDPADKAEHFYVCPAAKQSTCAISVPCCITSGRVTSRSRATEAA